MIRINFDFRFRLSTFACASILFVCLACLLSIQPANALPSTITVGNGPFGIAYESKRGEMFVTNSGDSTVSAIPDSTNTVTSFTSVGANPGGIVFDPARNEMFVANTGSNTVSVIFSVDVTVLNTITVGDHPFDVAYDSVMGEVFVTNYNANTVSVISDATNTVVATIPVGTHPRGIAYDSSNGEVFVVNSGSNNVSIINSTTNIVMKTISVGNAPYGIAYDSGRGTVFVANYASNTVSVISDTTNTVVATVNVGTNPTAAAYDSGKSLVFVTNSGSNTLSVISDITDSVVATINVGSGPTGLAYNSARGEVYVTNFHDKTVSVISDSTFTAYTFVTGQQSSTVLGQTSADTIIQNIAGLNYPNYHTFDSSGNLWVADSANNRVLRYTAPFTIGERPSLVIGQPGFSLNTGRETSSTTLAYPLGLAFDSSGNLWVADSDESRVIEYTKGAGFVTGQAASLVIGQPDFTTNSFGATSTKLFLPTSLAFDSSGNLWVADQFNNRVLEYTKGAGFVTGQAASLVLGQSSFTTGSAGTTSTSLTGPTGLAFDTSGNLWVADQSNKRILEYTKGVGFATGQAASLVLGQSDFTSSSFGTTSTTLYQPTSLAFDSSGNLWVADQGNNRVLEYSKGAGFVTGQAASLVLGQSSFTTGSSGTTSTTLWYPTNLAFDPSGNLWVADIANNRFLEYTKGAGFVTGQASSLVIGQPDFTTQIIGTTSTTMNFPTGLAFDSSGNLWVTDQSYNRVLEYTKGADFVTGQAASLVLGQPGFTTNTSDETPTTLTGPSNLGFDLYGNLWVVDRGNSRILEYFQGAGFVTGQAASLVLGQSGVISSTTLYQPNSLAFDSSGNLWVADQFNNRVLEYTKGAGFVTGQAASLVLGQSSFTTNTYGTTSTTLWSPNSLAFDSSGNLWVADGFNGRVLEYTKGAGFVTGQASSLVIGQLSFTAGSCSSGPTGLCFPTSLAFDSSGNLWVADENNRVLEFPKGAGFVTGQAASLVLGQSDFITETGSTSSATLLNPNSLAFDSSGNLWVADQSNHRVIDFKNEVPTPLVKTKSVTSGSNIISLGQFSTSFTGSASFTTAILSVQQTLANPAASNPSGTVVGRFYNVDSNSPDIISSRTIAISYNLIDTAGLDQSSIKINRLSGGTWTQLSSAVDTGTKKVTASTPGYSVFVLSGSAAPHCTVPISGPWTITSNCILANDATAPANVIVNNGAVLEIPSGVKLTIHFTTNQLVVHPGGDVLIKAGGKID